MPPPSSPSPPLIHLPRRVPVHGAGRFTIEELEDIGFDPSILKINSFIKIDGDDDDDEHYYKPLPPTRPTGKAAVLPTGEASSQLPQLRARAAQQLPQPEPQLPDANAQAGHTFLENVFDLFLDSMKGAAENARAPA